MTVGVCTWREPDPSGGAAGRTPGWAHSGLATLPDGRLLTNHPARSELVLIDLDGDAHERWPVAVVEAHGITVTAGPDATMWIADHAVDTVEVTAGVYRNRRVPTPVRGGVVELSLDGRERRRLPTPPLVGDGDVYRPTSVVVAPESGDVWVADGYGQSRVHRFDADGHHDGWFDGGVGAGRFVTPHSLHLDLRSGTPRLYVADRENGRLSLHDLDGRFLRTVGDGVLRRPSGMTACGDELVVADLTGRLTVFDADDRLLGHVGEAPEPVTDRPGWPNALDQDGRLTRPPFNAGTFNSPHDVTTLPSGEVAVCEWVLGGRIVVTGW